VAAESGQVTRYEKKVCLLGAAAVGKTSLVRRFVESIFSDSYLPTIGVKVDHKEVAVGSDVAAMALWDIEGETETRSVRFRYLRGAAGFLLVADGTRAETLAAAMDLQARVADRMGDLPFLLLMNKHDLARHWTVGAEELDALRARGWSIHFTSALTGAGVEEAFAALGTRLLATT
jgi:small GTP-binding protein